MTDPLLVAFGQRITRRREALGWSARELARKAGVSASTVVRAEHATGDVWMGIAIKMASALGASLPGMLGEPVCGTCDGHPPKGFTCNECGRPGGTTGDGEQA
jgi:transcriptional regulator with XRE-family HTH domain